jgi:hypothetical protein
MGYVTKAVNEADVLKSTMTSPSPCVQQGRQRGRRLVVHLECQHLPGCHTEIVSLGIFMKIIL